MGSYEDLGRHTFFETWIIKFANDYPLAESTTETTQAEAQKANQKCHLLAFC